MELKLLKRYSITIKYANLIFYLNFKAYSGVGKAAHCQLGVPCSVPAHATNFYTSTPVIEITTTIVDHISCMWSKVDNFSCYFSTNSRENSTTNLLLFRAREISKAVNIILLFRLGYHTFKRWPIDVYRISCASSSTLIGGISRDCGLVSRWPNVVHLSGFYVHLIERLRIRTSWSPTLSGWQVATWKSFPNIPLSADWKKPRVTGG